jgi:serine/threonine protein kinase/HAMP domain-containing protein
MDAMPTRIGRYEIEELVGEGATAVVYRAHDPAIGRTVAVKLLKTEHGIDEDYLTRFQREAQSAGAISHPNIVTIYDVGRVDGTPYITMEFLNEKTLADVIASGERLSHKRILSIGIQLALALDHAHSRGVIHRDIKPDNVLVLNNGENVKLTDFGIARLEGVDDAQRTHVGTVLGTPRYMSPEQALGRGGDGRSDLFSLGAILYELLTGRRAFDSNNLAMLMLQIVQQDPPPLTEPTAGVPEGLQHAVMKLLAKKPEQRFQSGDQLAEVLKRELEALTAQEEETSRNHFLPLRLKLAVITGTVLAVLFLISMGVVYNMESRVVRNQSLASGAALARFVAVHSAVPALDQNWLPLKLFVQDGKARGGFDYLVITDHDHVVQAATDPKLVGKRYNLPTNLTSLQQTADMTVSSFDAGSIPLNFFDTPILFQKTEVGRVYLGLDQSGQARVLHATVLLMAVLGFLAVLAVIGLSQFFGILILRPVRLLKRSLTDFGAGDFDRRISETRRDEIGELYTAFNRMAALVQSSITNEQAREAGPDLSTPQPNVGRDAAVPEVTIRANVA